MDSSAIIILELGFSSSLKYVAHSSNISFSSPTISPCLFLKIVVLSWEPVLVLRIPS